MAVTLGRPSSILLQENRQINLFGSFNIDDELKLRRLLYGQLGGRSAFHQPRRGMKQWAELRNLSADFGDQLLNPMHL